MKLRTTVLLPFICLYTLTYCQTPQLSISEKTKLEVADLKKRGVKKIVLFTDGCSGCEIKFKENDCECKDEGIFQTHIFYMENQKSFVNLIACCKSSTPKEIINTFFGTMDSLNKTLQKKTDAKNKFYPPVAVHQGYYSICYDSAGKKKFDFTIYQTQLKENSDEAKAWDKVPLFAERKAIYNYIKTFLKSGPESN